MAHTFIPVSVPVLAPTAPLEPSSRASGFVDPLPTSAKAQSGLTLSRDEMERDLSMILRFIWRGCRQGSRTTRKPVFSFTCLPSAAPPPSAIMAFERGLSRR